MVSISIVAENKPDAHQTTTCTDNESLQHLTIAVLLIKILFFFSTTQHKCPALATRSLLCFFILSSTLLRGVEMWKSLTN